MLANLWRVFEILRTNIYLCYTNTHVKISGCLVFSSGHQVFFNDSLLHNPRNVLTFCFEYILY